MSQISLIINTIFASFLAAGSVSWMYYADRLMELPSGVLGVALGTILLPMLARPIRTRIRMSTRACCDWACACASCWCCPVRWPWRSRRTSDRLAVPVRQVHHGGRGDDQRALVAYSVGLLGIILVKVLAPGFYAQQNIPYAQ